MSTQDISGVRLTRRGLVKTSGAVGGLAVSQSLFASASAQDATPTPPASSGLVSNQLPNKWDKETDVLIVGTGAAGCSAAVAARQGGADVLLLERGTFAGGTTLTSGNAYWIPNNSKMQALGLEDPRDDAIRYMSRLAYAAMYDPESPTYGLPQRTFDWISAFYDNGSVAIDSLEEWGALYSMTGFSSGASEHPEWGDPDYNADLPEDKAPYGRHMNPDPERGGSSASPTQMLGWLEKQGAATLLEHRVVGVYQNTAGQIVGAKVEHKGTTLAIRARKAIVFGSGGFTQNAQLVTDYLRGPIFAGCGVPTNTGDFVDIGLALGAELGNMNNAWWVQCPLELALVNPAVIGLDVWLPYGDSMVIVNKYGKRVASEKMVYNERSQTHHIWNPERREYSNLVQFMIYDDVVANDPTEWGFRYPVPMPDKESDLVISGNTWEELAANIDARLESLRGLGALNAKIGPGVMLADDFVDSLKQTLTNFNSYAETGVDEEFGRGSTLIQTAWGVGNARAAELANPTMAPFAKEGPYHCILLGGMTLDTKGGPVTDTVGRIMHVSGTPIAGLYGAGNCVASGAGNAYFSAGGTIGPALTFGYLAGKQAATEEEKPAN